MGERVPEPSSSAASFVAEVEAWLRAQVESDDDIRWRSHGFSRVVGVRNAVELAELVSDLSSLGEWGVLDQPWGPWAQTMRVTGGYIVEVHTGEPDGWVERVRAIGGRGTAGPRKVSRNKSAGLLGATHLDGDVIDSAVGAAEVLWAWLHGGLPDGYDSRAVDPDFE